MIFNLEWKAPVQLQAGTGLLTYTLDRASLPDTPGIYVFGRRYGDSFEALYVGRAANIAKRVIRQLNNNRLMNHLLRAQNGQRVVVPGVFTRTQGQRLSKCLPIIEHTLIRHFLDLEHALVNKQGARILTHEIVSSGVSGQHGIPRRMVVDQ